MEVTCQRCHESLRDADRYCPACGLPQLTYTESEAQPVANGFDSAAGAANEQPGQPSLVNGIAWRTALQASLMLAVPAGVLCSNLTSVGKSLFSLLWMLGAAGWAVAVYARRTRPSRLPSGVGFRIGLITGLLAGWLMVGVDGAALWASRFVFHQGSQIDSLRTSQFEESMKLNQQVWTQMGIAGAQITQSSQILRSWMLSPEGRAGSALSESIFTAILLIVFAAIGGAVGARFLVPSRRPSA